MAIQIIDRAALSGADLDRTHLGELAASDFEPLNSGEPNELIGRESMYLGGHRFSIWAYSGRSEPDPALVKQANAILNSLSVREELCPCRD